MPEIADALGRGNGSSAWDKSVALALMDFPAHADSDYNMHPAIADNCMHVGVYVGKKDGNTRIPASLACFYAPRMPNSKYVQNSCRPDLLFVYLVLNEKRMICSGDNNGECIWL